MEDFPDDPMEDREFSRGLYQKLTELLSEIEKLATSHLMGFSAVELQALEKVYGKNLAYDLYADVVNALASPHHSETIH